MDTKMKKVENSKAVTTAPKAETKEEVKREFVDVTKERIKYVAKKYCESIAKIYSDGRQYKVVFTEGYEVEGQKEVLVKGIVQICRYSWLATDNYLKKHPEVTENK